MSFDDFEDRAKYYHIEHVCHISVEGYHVLDVVDITTATDTA